MTDLHSHILPGMDDGSSCPEESLAMLAMEAAQGITLVAATPHFDPRTDEPQAFLERRALAEAALRGAMGADPRLPRLILGAEVNGIVMNRGKREASPRRERESEDTI